MCAEKIEELTDSHTPISAVSKTPTSWGPAVTVLILFPVLSFIVSDFILFPRLQARFEHAVQQVNNLPKDLNPAATNVSQTATSKKETYEIRDIMSNVSGDGQVRYARVSFVLEGTVENFPDLMKQNEARLIDATLDVFSVLSIGDLQNSNIKNIVKGQLLQRFETILQAKSIEDLFFSQFVIK